MITVILLIITAILWGVTPILEKIGLGSVTDGVKPFTAVAIRSFAISIALLIALSVSGGIKEIFQLNRKTIIIFSISGIMAGLLGMLTYFMALKKGAVSRIVPIAATYPLVAAVLSIIILGEKVTWGRVLGTMFIVVGIWLVK